MTWLFSRFQVIIKIIKLIKNWHMYPIVYFGLTKSEHVIFEMRNGFKIKLRTRSTDLMALTHVWLIQEYSRPGFEIQDNDIIIDIGAHIGLFALFAAQFCKKGKIYCFEPIKKNYDMLLSNIQLNNLTNIVPFNMAVSNEKSTATIFLNQDESGHSMYSTTSTPIQVQTLSLKNIIDDNNIACCNFIKMDCEGSEYSIIDSLSDNYLGKINKIIIEYHFADSQPDLLNKLENKLKTSLFEITKRKLFADIGFLYALKK